MSAPQMVPAERVAEVLELLAELVSDARITRAAADISRDGAITHHVARLIAGETAAVTVRTVLAGLLAPDAGGVTTAGLQWSAAMLRRLLDEGDQDLDHDQDTPGGAS